MDAHGFDISIGSLISVFQFRRRYTNQSIGFNIDLWRLPILDNGLSVSEVPIEGRDLSEGAKHLAGYALLYAVGLFIFLTKCFL